MAWTGWLAVVHFHGFAAADQPTDKQLSTGWRRSGTLAIGSMRGGGGVRIDSAVAGALYVCYGCQSDDGVITAYQLVIGFRRWSQSIGDGRFSGVSQKRGLSGLAG